MSRPKTLAQWRREFPAYDEAIRAVEAAATVWPRAPRMIAHIHPDTHIVSIVLDGSEKDCAAADRLLPYRDGWDRDNAHARAVWRKVVAR